MGYVFQVEQVPFLRAIGHRKSPLPKFMVLSDEGEESKLGDSPCSWITGLSIRVLCRRISICGDDGLRGF